MQIHFQASLAEGAQEAFRSLTTRYGQTEDPSLADVIVALGGDGQTLHALQDGIRLKKPVFGLNFGRVGYLQNLHKIDSNLIERIEAAETIELSPLRVEAEFVSGDVRTDFAINEIHVCNQDRTKVVYLRIMIDGEERIPRLGGDGLMIATTVGSTGYSKSAHNLILPLGDDIIAFTPNNASTPDHAHPRIIRPCSIVIEVIDPKFRRADVYADSHLVGKDCLRVAINLDTDNRYRLLFDRGYSLHEKVMRSQFSTPIL